MIEEESNDGDGNNDSIDTDNDERFGDDGDDDQLSDVNSIELVDSLNGD